MAKQKGSELVSEAVKDAKALKEAALSAAKNQLVESLAPAVRELLEKQIRGVIDEKRGLTGRIGQSQRGDYMSDKEQKYEESADKGEDKMADDKKNDKELDMESLASFFPQVSEEPEGLEGEVDEMGNPVMPGMPSEAPAMGAIPTLGEEPAMDGEHAEPDADDEHEAPKMEAKKKKDDEEDKEPMDEEIEISEAELRKVYEAALQTEAQVTKGFADMTKAGEIDDVIKDVDKGLADVKKGEHDWDKETPPAKQDFMVKERVEALIRQGLAENKALRKGIAERDEMIKTLAAKLHETNLFNAKVLHVNRFLNSHAGKLTSEQKTVVLESIDKATSIEQVAMVYEAINKTFVAAAKLSEGTSRKPAANSQRPRTSGAADPKALRESADRTSQSSAFSRMAQLAGLGNLK